MKKPKFPKKAKLISQGGLYKIIEIKEFVPKIKLPIFRLIELSTPDFYDTETFKYVLTFAFSRVYKGYAEYEQVNFIRVSPIENNLDK